MNKDKDDKNIISFPEKNKRKSLKKDKVKSSKEAGRAQKDQEVKEERYRAEYRASRAKDLSSMARSSAGGKVPLVNWHKIPIFTRIAIGSFLLVQIIMSLFVSVPDKVMVIYYLGFVPAMYSGSVDWSWGALISPFTSLLIHGGWMHLVFNVVMMMAMGIFFERQFGAKITAIFFVLCGLAGSLVCFILSPESSIPVIGASGAISGLFAVAFMIMIEQGMLGPDAKKRGIMPFILLWSTIIVVFGMMSHDVSWQSHIGGFWGGIGLFHLWKKGKIII